MGRAKQMLEFEGETLLHRAAKTAVLSNCRPIAVILGSQAEKLEREIGALEIEIARNDNWREGMGGSIRAGLNRILEIKKEIKAVVIMVCDQPFVSPEVIKNLIKKYKETTALIVASEYQETLGVPALFDKAVFPHLQNLHSSGGAKKIIEKFRSETVSIQFPAGNFDIDTPEDFQKLKQYETEKN